MGHELVMTKITMGKRKRILLTIILMIMMLKLAFIPKAKKKHILMT